MGANSNLLAYIASGGYDPRQEQQPTFYEQYVRLRDLADAHRMRLLQMQESQAQLENQRQMLMDRQRTAQEEADFRRMVASGAKPEQIIAASPTLGLKYATDVRAAEAAKNTAATSALTLEKAQSDRDQRNRMDEYNDVAYLHSLPQDQRDQEFPKFVAKHVKLGNFTPDEGQTILSQGPGYWNDQRMEALRVQALGAVEAAKQKTTQQTAEAGLAKSTREGTMGELQMAASTMPPTNDAEAWTAWRNQFSPAAQFYIPQTPSRVNRDRLVSMSIPPKDQQEYWTKQVQAVAPQLARSPDAPSYLEARSQLDPRMQAYFPATFDPKNPQPVLEAGMTPEQITTTRGAAAQRAQTARHEAVMESQGWARNSLEKQRLNMTLGAGLDANGQPLAPDVLKARALQNPNAVAAAAGKLAPATLRAMLRGAGGKPLMADILTLDPTWDEAQIDMRFKTAQEFASTMPSHAGGQLLALNTMIHHADLYLEVADALKNGTWRPGNHVYNAVATIFGQAPPLEANLVSRFLAGETAKVATGGVPGEQEVQTIAKNLNADGSPEQLRKAGLDLLRIGAGRMTPLRERLQQNHLDKMIPVLGEDATEILNRRGIDPMTLKPRAAAGGTAAAPPNKGDTKQMFGHTYTFDGTQWVR